MIDLFLLVFIIIAIFAVVGLASAKMVMPALIVILVVSIVAAFLLFGSGG